MTTLPQQKAPAIAPLAQILVIGAWVLILFSIGLIAMSAVPAVARGLGLTEVRMVRRDFQRRSPMGQVGVDAVHDFERDIGESLERLERLPEFEPRDLERRELGKRAQADAEDRVEVLEAKRTLVLRTQPDAHADKVALVKPGSSLVILRRQGGWIRVFSQLGDEPMQSGWIETRDLALP